MDICVGMIGCGGIATAKHMPGLVKAGAKITALYDVNQKSAQDAAQKFGTDAVVYETVDALLANKEITAVHICTPNKTHADLAVRAMQAGKHVMCEKPMAMNAIEAARMLEVSRNTNRKLTIGYQGRFRKEVQLLKEMCMSDQLGEIYFARAHALRRRGVPTWGVYQDSSLQGGGCLIDIGTHALDLVLWLMDNYEPEYVIGNTYRKIIDRPTDANVWGTWNSALLNVEDSAFAMLRMKNGATVELECSWAINCRNAVESNVTLAGTKAGADTIKGLKINGASGGSLYINDIDTNNKSGTSFDVVNIDDPGSKEIAVWVDAIKNDRPPLVLPEQALMVARIIDGIYESSKTGRPVNFD
ncbi:MAG: Gfo/Idh/MocA family oxidoreductase [Eubacteriales bacterium]|nr:Gfo/Idh/MocA family oxidoreductase [Eubacteriales bacterium]